MFRAFARVPTTSVYNPWGTPNLWRCEVKPPNHKISSPSTATYLWPWPAELRWPFHYGNDNYPQYTGILHLSLVCLWILQAHSSSCHGYIRWYLLLKGDKKWAQFHLQTGNWLRWSVLWSLQSRSHKKSWAWRAFLEWQRNSLNNTEGRNKTSSPRGSFSKLCSSLLWLDHSYLPVSPTFTGLFEDGQVMCVGIRGGVGVRGRGETNAVNKNEGDTNLRKTLHLPKYTFICLYAHTSVCCCWVEKRYRKSRRSITSTQMDSIWKQILSASASFESKSHASRSKNSTRSLLKSSLIYKAYKM